MSRGVTSIEQLNEVLRAADVGEREPFNTEELRRLRELGVDECPGCKQGLGVRSCPVHGLNGYAPR